MNRPSPKTVRRRFLMALGHALHVTWPVLSTMLAIQVALGLLIGFFDGWSVGDAVSFPFFTSLTIAYGDIVPRPAPGRLRHHPSPWCFCTARSRARPSSSADAEQGAWARQLSVRPTCAAPRPKARPF